MSVNVLAIVSYCNNKFQATTQAICFNNYDMMYNTSNRVKRAIKLMSMSDTSRIRCLMPSYSVQRQLELSLNHCCRKAYYGYDSSLWMHTYALEPVTWVQNVFHNKYRRLRHLIYTFAGVLCYTGLIVNLSFKLLYCMYIVCAVLILLVSF